VWRRTESYAYTNADTNSHSNAYADSNSDAERRVAE
jgi:hypothetical protein